MKIIKGDLILIEDYEIDDDLKVEGNIYGKDGIRYNINARNIDAGDINAGDINARNIDAGDINARNIDAWNIDAWNIDAWNINARNIDAGDINARNIDAGDINAGDINARNIIYYAVCFAYNNFKCKSIKGRRDNCKHFVLDGEIIIKDEEEKA